MRIAIKSIQLTDLEGDADTVKRLRGRIFSTFAEANAALDRSAVPKGAYNKHWFALHYTDGVVHGARLDLTSDSPPDALEQRVRGSLEFVVEAQLSSITDAHRAYARAFLRDRQLSDEAPSQAA